MLALHPKMSVDVNNREPRFLDIRPRWTDSRMIEPMRFNRRQRLRLGIETVAQSQRRERGTTNYPTFDPDGIGLPPTIGLLIHKHRIDRVPIRTSLNGITQRVGFQVVDDRVAHYSERESLSIPTA